MRSQALPGAIVLGANAIALGVARSLGVHGIPVWVYDPKRSIAHFSRYTKRAVISDRDKCELLMEEGRKHDLKDWLVIPVEDQYVELLALNHKALSSIYRVTTPPLDIARFALDKRLTYRRASDLGIATPWTLTTSDSRELTGRDLPYPLILKPAVNHHYFPKANLKALPVETPGDLQKQYSEMQQYIPSEEILLQERIPGMGENQFSYAALFKEGREVASLVARRTRQYPLDFGTASTFVETIVEPIVAEYGRKWLESVGFDGIAEVEFKFDPRDGKHKILDVNIRPWGWHTLGKAAGMDFCYLLWRQAAGLAVAVDSVVGKAAWCRELNDVMAILKSRKPAEEAKRVLKSVLGGAFVPATISLRDPAPLFAEFALRALQVVRPRS